MNDLIKRDLTFLLDIGRESKINFRRFRKILSFPWWNYAMIATVRMRKYREGLDACEMLLTLIEKFRDKMKVREYELFKIKINFFIIDLLDRTDQWETFMDRWESFNKEMDGFHFRIGGTDESRRFPRGEETMWAMTHHIHLQYRSEIIKRKLGARLKGRKEGNLMHKGPISDEEARERFLEMMLGMERRTWYGGRIVSLSPYLSWILFFLRKF